MILRIDKNTTELRAFDATDPYKLQREMKEAIQSFPPDSLFYTLSNDVLLVARYLQVLGYPITVIFEDKEMKTYEDFNPAFYYLSKPWFDMYEELCIREDAQKASAQEEEE